MNSNQPERPEFCTDDMLLYLGILRATGLINMLGVGRELENEFGLTADQAREVLVYWMKTFKEEEPNA